MMTMSLCLMLSNSKLATQCNSVQKRHPSANQFNSEAGQRCSSKDCLLPTAGRKSLQRDARTQPKAVYGPKPLGVDPGKKLMLLGTEKATPKPLEEKKTGSISSIDTETKTTGFEMMHMIA